MKLIKTFELFLGGDKYVDPCMASLPPTYKDDTEDALEWWENLSKEEKREIESKNRTIAITNSNIKRLYLMKDVIK